MYNSDIERLKRERNLETIFRSNPNKKFNQEPVYTSFINFSNQYSPMQHRSNQKISKIRLSDQEYIQQLEAQNHRLKERQVIMERNNENNNYKIHHLEEQVKEQNQLLNQCQQEIGRIRRNYNQMLRTLNPSQEQKINSKEKQFSNKNHSQVHKNSQVFKQSTQMNIYSKTIYDLMGIQNQNTKRQINIKKQKADKENQQKKQVIKKNQNQKKLKRSSTTAKIISDRPIHGLLKHMYL